MPLTPAGKEALDRLIRDDAASQAYYARWGKVAYEQRPEAERAAQRRRDIDRPSLQLEAAADDDREYILLKSRESSLLPFEQERLLKLHQKFYGLAPKPAVTSAPGWDGRAPGK